MKKLKAVGMALFSLLLLFGASFAWQVFAQDSTDAEKSNTVYLPLITSNRPQTQAAAVSTVAPDQQWLGKPEEYEGFVPTPWPDTPLPADWKPVTPGQPLPEPPRPSQEELDAMAEIHVPPDAPYVVYADTGDAFRVPSKSSALSSEAVVIVKVSKIHPSRWNSVDGKRPANPFDFNHPSYIYTLANMEVQEVLRGAMEPGEVLTISMNGGQVGNDRLVDDSYRYKFAEGDLLFLYTGAITLDIPGIYWRIDEQYIIDSSNGLAVNAFETRSVDELRAEVADAEKQLAQYKLQQP
ncbi:MAG: hypothetical protein DYG89_15435 [Caldilinea sp. CFX5]|nr:hypothetical protein [Caldilinea sp. CFX5]